MKNKFHHLLNISSDKEMPFEGLLLILSRHICHHKDISNYHRLSHNGTVVGVTFLDATYIDLSMFSTEFTELGLYMNIMAICYSRKVVGQYCKRYKKGLIKKNLFYQKNMKRLREENIDFFWTKHYFNHMLIMMIIHILLKNGVEN